MNEETLNSLATTIYTHNQSVGWWDGEQDDVDTKLLLSITEIAETTEGSRKGLMDNHLSWREMAEVELADTLIRILDFGGRHDLYYEKTHFLWQYPEESIYKKLFKICRLICNLPLRRDRINYHYSDIIEAILLLGRDLEYDIETAMYEKLEYNKTRPDHKLENRMKKGGKKI